MVGDARVRTEWWTPDIGAHIDLDRPGIYEWQLGGEAVYIGKAKGLRTRIRAYLTRCVSS